MSNYVKNVSAVQKYECCGCTACKSVCPTKAIKMHRDEQGFDYPLVNKEKCVDCGLCLTTCQRAEKYKFSIRSCYAAKNSIEEVVLSSSSGGIVDDFCNTIIKLNGIVYAACYNECFELVYKRAATYEDCKSFRRSKYVQANLKETFQHIYNDLLEGKFVLFVGTSCYVAALRSYLNSKKCNISNLFLIDFICHGVPSPELFSRYVSFVNKKNNLLDIVFRNKRKSTGENLDIPWKYGNYSCSLVYENGHCEVDTLKSRIFLNFFTSNNCLRPQCYKCKFIGTEKPGDITVADFWGVESEHPDFADQQGISAIMIHTLQGQRLIEDCEKIIKIESSVDKISKKQGMLKAASKKGEKYDEFWEDYKNHKFKFLAKKYGEYSFEGLIRQSKLYKLWAKIRYGE